MSRNYEITDDYSDVVEIVMDRVYKKVGDNLYYHLNRDGLPIMIWKLLFGGMSSSSVLQIVIDRYGFDEVESDLRWLKRKGYNR